MMEALLEKERELQRGAVRETEETCRGKPGHRVLPQPKEKALIQFQGEGAKVWKSGQQPASKQVDGIGQRGRGRW